ncbi:hypothetical protein [Bacillus cereus group sp. TH152-1LC]|uniref:hypothetical protein n=1 Tax=Bacillus cereus group sp. TH152-1LC TaxID=3018060 RepID=UPI0022E59BFF|nr:hypothetical protein [Bacillus cereus group sp. TH152-1LC]MDA1679870.1 hypothetical protein [Bacillus cereus group sp. TH152-1LC]
MEHNKNGMLALIVLFAGLAFFCYRYGLSFMGNCLKISSTSFRRNSEATSWTPSH